MSQSITVYGIKNCTTVKKVLDYLTANSIAYTFFDYKKQPVTKTVLALLLDKFGADTVINTKSATYKKLSSDEQNALNTACATNDITTLCQLVADKPSIIKRPLIVGDDAGAPVTLVGFSVADYDKVFAQ